MIFTSGGDVLTSLAARVLQLVPPKSRSKGRAAPAPKTSQRCHCLRNCSAGSKGGEGGKGELGKRKGNGNGEGKEGQDSLSTWIYRAEVS